MKVLSLLQPWATFVVIGAKRIETRSWNTKHRGKLLIHASKGKNWKYNDLFNQFRDEFNIDLGYYDSLPFGSIIGKVNLEWTAKTEILKERLSERSNILVEHMMHSGEQELAFGDYSPNRLGWYFDDPVQFKDPIPCKGSLGLWEYDVQTPFPTVQVSDTTKA